MGQWGNETYNGDSTMDFLQGHAVDGDLDSMTQKMADAAIDAVFSSPECQMERLGVVAWCITHGFKVTKYRLNKALGYANYELIPEKLGKWQNMQGRKDAIVLEMNKIRYALDNDGVARESARTITLPCFGIIVNLTGDGGGAISSNLQEEPNTDDLQSFTERDEEIKNTDLYNAGCDALESFIMACALSGVDIESKSFVEALETTMNAMGNNMD